MNSSTISEASTALVLGGGGSLGNAWVIGVVAGLAEAGLDVTGADLVVGTSAGSTAAAQLAGTSPAQLLADILAAAPAPGRSGPGPMHPGRSHLETTDGIIASARNAEDMRRAMGAWALGFDAASDPDAQAGWRDTVGSRFSPHTWPSTRLLITAVDADTGEPVVFDSESGVELVDAVAASCAGGFAYGIGERRYLDGGYRSNAENADLASGSDRVLVLSPFGGRTRLPLGWRLDLDTQVEDLRAHGARVETIFPDSVAVAVFGDNMMDLSKRPAAARAGYEQGRALAPGLIEFWVGSNDGNSVELT
ncbi:patatin-like phospholipase family protein [Glaciibacter flavus]|uniref:Patatin-like phospholipase family protein n=1 Tax=Orlajensenia flava TaxID=2565934 RepID=A0A4S4FY44_9MICO|nr:patatin-like phospholipase family protein [Glaciibacter flavus]THG35082.1 patatin-like phospholipase family protein [Glaciibacter flavus]